MLSLTIRNVSEKAGYSSATLYKYFKNFSHLIIYAGLKFDKEIAAFIEEYAKGEIDDLKLWSKAYEAVASYSFKYPNVFECLFVLDYADVSPEKILKMRKNSVLTEMVRIRLGNIAEEKDLPDSALLKIHQACLAMTVGKILLHLRGRMRSSNDSLAVREIGESTLQLIQSNLEGGQA